MGGKSGKIGGKNGKVLGESGKVRCRIGKGDDGEGAREDGQRRELGGCGWSRQRALVGAGYRLRTMPGTRGEGYDGAMEHCQDGGGGHGRLQRVGATHETRFMFQL